MQAVLGHAKDVVVAFGQAEGEIEVIEWPGFGAQVGEGDEYRLVGVVLKVLGGEGCGYLGGVVRGGQGVGEGAEFGVVLGKFLPPLGRLRFSHTLIEALG